MLKLKTFEIKEGMELVCDTLRWDEGWEFDCPSMMISPVIRCFEDGRHHESIREEVLINGIVKGAIKDENFEETWGWRGFKLPVLKRRFREALAGKKFPKANYKAERVVVKIVKDDRGELIWEEIKPTENATARGDSRPTGV
ncbi:MAG TPA: hypothetical protein VGH19_06520 [Verrucomicrobiae bacterium]